MYLVGNVTKMTELDSNGKLFNAARLQRLLHQYQCSYNTELSHITFLMRDGHFESM